MSGRPYPGLRPFKPQEAGLFFGRERQIAQVCKKLVGTRLVSVVGVSGCGKSSLVRAGVLPALELDESAQWRVVVLHPGGHPFQYLAQGLLRNAALQQALLPLLPDEADTESAQRSALRDVLLGSALSLTDVLRDARLHTGSRVLIVVDQFEELLRLPPDEADAFISLLLAAVRQKEIPISLLLTMRADVIGQCARFRGLPERLNAGQFLMPRLTRKQLHDVICKPAEAFGGAVDERLAHRLLRESGNDPSHLPVLQHCLMRMWAVAGQEPDTSDHSGPHLGIADYQTVGGLQHALSRHADEAYEELDEHGQRIAEILFRCVSERSPDRQDMRRPTTLQNIAAVVGAAVSDVQVVAEIFRRSDRCFLSPSAGTPLEPDTLLDISHESLIQQWKRMSAWASEEAKSADMYRRLEQTARLWKSGDAALWTTPDLEHALAWKAQNRPTAAWARRYCAAIPDVDAATESSPESESAENTPFPNMLRETPDSMAQVYATGFDVALEFLEASAQAREEQRLQEQREHRTALRRAHWQLACVTLGLVIVMAVALWGWWERLHRESETTARERAESETQHLFEKQTEVVSLVSDTLADAERGLTAGTQDAQAVLAVLIRDYLPTWENEFDDRFALIAQNIQTLYLRFQQNAASRELERLNQIQLPQSSSVRVGSRRSFGDLYDSEPPYNLEAAENLFWLLESVWESGGELTRLEVERKLHQFRQEVLYPLETGEIAEPVNPDELLRDINEVFYVLLLDIQNLAVPFKNIQEEPSRAVERIRGRDALKRGIQQNFSRKIVERPRTETPLEYVMWQGGRKEVSWEFKNGKIPESIDEDIHNLINTLHPLETEMGGNIEDIYLAGQQAVRAYIEQKLANKEQEVENISYDVERLNEQYADSRRKKAAAITTMTARITTASNAYNVVTKTLADLQSDINVQAAESAYEHQHYADTLRFALRALTASPDIEAAYTRLILSLQRLHERPEPPRELLYATFDDILKFSEDLLTQRIFLTLTRENQTYLARVFYEFSVCFEKENDAENAVKAIGQAVKLAVQIKNNTDNVRRLQQRQRELEQR